MKKVYHNTWVENIRIQETSRGWFSKNLLTKDQVEQIDAGFPVGFYRPGIFVAVGLFLFTLVATSFFAGFLALFFLENSGTGSFTALNLVCALCFFTALEYMIKDRKLYHSGIDNALLYAAVGSLLFAVFSRLENLDIWQYCLVAVLVLTVSI